MTESKVNPEAAQMRVFEIDLMDYPRLESLVEGSKMHIEHSPIVEMLLNRTSCVLTDEYFEYVIANKDMIQEMLNKWYLKIKTKIGEAGGNAAKERFYARHIACAIVGGWIAFKLGFIRFDLVVIVKWAVAHVDRLRGYTQELRTTTEERLARMMSDFLGAMIVTNNYEMLDARSGKTEIPIISLRRDACVRVVIGGNATMPERGRVFVAVAAMDDWCKKNGMNGLEFRKALMNEGYLRLTEKAKPIYLARGVPSMPIGQQRCVELEYAKMQGIVSDVTVSYIPVTNEHSIA